MFELKSKVLKVTKVLKKSKAHMIQNLKVGDLVQLSINAENAGSNRGRSYSSYICIKNLNTEEYTYKSFNEIDHLYRVVELEEVSDV